MIEECPMPGSRGASPRERQILQEVIAAPLKRLRRTAGDPTGGKIAEAAGLSRNTVDNVFNARHLTRFDSVEEIVVALGGDVAEWRDRWATARDRIDRLDTGVETPPEQEPADIAPVPVRRRRLPSTAVAALALLAAGAVLTLAARGDGVSGAAPTHPAGEQRTARTVFLPHDLPYVQCADRTRSVLSRPGRSRGGTPQGQIRPGERFIVTGQTAFWKYGHTDAAPVRTGWVLADYLCHTDH
jgi:hypothetical protein